MNILGEPTAAVVIDWLAATSGDPAADVCRSYLLLEMNWPEIAVAYVDTYCRTAGISGGGCFAGCPSSPRAG
jgi:hypothetical protein